MDWGTVVVALIAALGGLGSSIIVARSTSEKLIHQLEMGQAVQNERMESYQRTTNEKLDQLSARVDAQSANDTRLALVEAEVRRLGGNL